MKKAAKPKVKTATKIANKKPVIKNKKVVQKPVSAKKRPLLAKKSVGKKALLKTKKQKFLAFSFGALIIVALAVIISSVINSSQLASSNNTSVLGWFSKSSASKISAPTGLKATTNDSTVTLSWGYVSRAAYYNIYRSSSWIGGMKKIATGTFKNLTYTDTTTKPSKRYRYSVSASSGTSESNKSAEKAIVASKYILPAKPTGLRYNGSSSGYTNDYASVLWNPQSYTDGYYIYCNNCTTKKMSVSTASSYDDWAFGKLMHKEFDVTASTDYVVQVSAYRVISGKIIESAKSDAVTFNSTTTAVIEVPARPTRLKYNGSDNTHTQATMLWNVNSDSVTGYYLYCNECATKKIAVSKNSYYFDAAYGDQMYKMFSVSAETNYSVYVTAYKTVDQNTVESPKSEVVKFNSTTTQVVAPVIPPAAPTNFQITRLTWNRIVFQYKSTHATPGGDYLYCEGCAEYKMEINSTNLVSGGISADGSEKWELQGLTPETKYNLSLSSFNGSSKRAESARTETKYMGTLIYGLDTDIAP